MKKIFSFLLSVSMLFVCGCGSAAAVCTEPTADDASSMTLGESSAVSSDDFVITVSETDDDGQIEVVTYTLEDLSCDVYDGDGNEVYSGPAVVEDSVARYTICSSTVKSGGTTYWYPTSNSSGFNSGSGVAVTVSIKTNLTASKTIGLTNGGDSSTVTNKDISAILYTGNSEYWKFYVKNNSSSDFKVTGGTLTWGI